jgi:hypothetical protein
MKQILALLLMVLLIFSACKKDEDEKVYQVKYEVTNLLSVNSHIKITYMKNNNTNVVDGPLTAGQKWELTYSGRSGEQTMLSGLVLNDSANFDLRIVVDNSTFMQDKGYCQGICDSVEVVISRTLD